MTEPLEERVRIVERDVAVIKFAVENHIPTLIRKVESDLAGLRGLIVWFFGLAIGGLITGTAQLVLKLLE